MDMRYFGSWNNGMPQTEKRFQAIDRLYGQGAVSLLAKAHVGVVGVGGVGSWAVEALARSGVGELSLFDLDEVCLSNVNRQIHATDTNVGRAKVQVLAERIQTFAPDCRVHAEEIFFTESTVDLVLGRKLDFVIDAIDGAKQKARLIAECVRRKIPVITTGGAGGRTDPTQVYVGDLGRTRDDPLLLQLRKQLRREYGFPNGSKRKFHVPCVTSTELPRFPQGDGSVALTRESGADYRLNCDAGFGSITHLTGTYGFVMAAHVIGALTAPVNTPEA